MTEIQYHSIGIIHSPFKDLEGTPIQPAAAKDVAGSVEIYPEYSAALADLDGFSHIFLLYHFHLTQTVRLKVIPFLDTLERGLFATRAPCRPNPVGLSLVRLQSIEGCVLSILDVDVLDGTPLLDIKPYFADFDRPDRVRCGWVESAKFDISHTRADNRFAD